MKIQAITDAGGLWFDIDKATKFQEESDWDGSNHISKATNTQVYHEALYKTPGKKHSKPAWILNEYSDYASVRDTYEVISEEEAAQWFAKQSIEAPEELKTLFNDLEVK